MRIVKIVCIIVALWFLAIAVAVILSPGDV